MDFGGLFFSLPCRTVRIAPLCRLVRSDPRCARLGRHVLDRADRFRTRWVEGIV
jgi:hypothetical protein